MGQDLSRLPPETFLWLAVEGGGLDLDEITRELSPEAADALRRIAVSAQPPVGDIMRSAPTRGITHPVPGHAARSLDSQAPSECPACGRINQPGDSFCRTCGRNLDRSTPLPVTLNDLVEQGRLTPEQAQEAKSAILFHQSNYTAGTRYSIFGESQ
jgi:hypothetical protein